MELCKSTRLSFTETGAISVIPVPKPTESQGYSSISANCNLTPPPLPSQPYVNRQIHDWHRENATPANKAETRQLANHTQLPSHTESLLIASFPTGHERFAATILHIFLSLVTLVKEGAVFGKSETRKACRLLDKLAPGPKKLFTCGEILFDLVPSPNRTCRLFAEAMHYDSASGANAMRSFLRRNSLFHAAPPLSVAIINCFIHFTTVEMIDQGLSYLRWTLLMWKDAKPEVQRRSKDIMASLREEGLDDSLELETTFSFLHTKP
ncbi:hypothetical protein BLNAU_10132 [Blattamonas nauphoetae]|nr:hypothetical protein BLNAU_10132 [Blattamonas nauphoetae]